MAETRIERRLAAILAADVVGYSRLMGINEEATLAALKVCRRELIDPKIAEYRGRIFKTTGDGALVEFASAVDATCCAMEIQHAMAERNAAIPEDSRIEFRLLDPKQHARRDVGIRIARINFERLVSASRRRTSDGLNAPRAMSVPGTEVP
jgi:class 3 adenylate cyclase